MITIESGPVDDAALHARLKQVGVHPWILELVDHRGKRGATPVRSTIEACINALVEDCGWILTPLDDDPLRTSDQEH